MKCPHCGAVIRSKVLESRQHDGRVYRRRACGACFKYFVSQEEAPPGLKMPDATQSRHRLTDRKNKPEEAPAHAPRGSGAHLQNLWR